MKKILGTIGLLGLMAGLSGCGQQGNAPSTASTATSAARPSPGGTAGVSQVALAPVVDPEAVVVTVNSNKITEGQVDREVAKRLAVQRQRMPAGMDIPPEQIAMLRHKVVDLLVEMDLISEKLEEKNISVTDEQVSEEIQKIAGEQKQTVAELEKEITEQGMTMADLNEQIRLKLRIERLMEAEKFDATITEAEAKAFYEENPQHFNQAEQVQASHILCGKRGITEAEYPAELEKIQAAQARLKAGEDFAAVAKAVSACPSSAQGGDLGFFGKGQMDPAFEKVAFETEVGATSDIVKTSFGYHLIRVTDKKAASTVPFEEVKPDITAHLARQKKQEFWTTYYQAVKDSATIEYSPTEQRLRDATEQAQEQMLRQQQQLMMPPQ
jgi:peptidyl-prolyl cis-trans isomerase C